MKRFLLLLLLCLFPVVGHAATIITAPDPISRACATGFTRVDSNFCASTSGNSLNAASLTENNTCQSVNINTTWGVPSSARMVMVDFYAETKSNNAAGFREWRFSMWQTNVCGSLYQVLSAGIREISAVVAGTILKQESRTVIIPVVNGSIYYTASDFSSGSAPVMILGLFGYYD